MLPFSINSTRQGRRQQKGCFLHVVVESDWNGVNLVAQVFHGQLQNLTQGLA